MQRPLIVTTKTGFKINSPNIPVIIRDDMGKMFYSTEAMAPKVTQFNLPPGKYIVDRGYFSPMFTPVNFKLPKLPPKERNFKYPTDFKIVWGDNPNKCTIQWAKKRIFFDDSLRDALKPELHFILMHEYGHAKYITEKFADLFAARQMLKQGYNPSQIGLAPIHSLSDMQLSRKKFIVDNLIKCNG